MTPSLRRVSASVRRWWKALPKADLPIEKRGGYTPTGGTPPTQPPPKPSDARRAIPPSGFATRKGVR